MKELYHFSHFLEFLCGVYFGGFALLGFIQKDALAATSALIEKRKDRANRTRVMSDQYFRTRITSPWDGVLRFLTFGIAWIMYVSLDRLFTIMFIFANFLIKVFGSPSKEIFLKKYFPGFFFSGCFCLVMVLLSAFQMENKNEVCAAAVDRFAIYYGASNIAFQFWAMIIFPFLVNRFDYFHLTLASIAFCLTLMYMSITHACHLGVDLNLGWLFAVKKGEWLKVSLLGIALLPLLLMLSFLILVFVLWEVPVIFLPYATRYFGDPTKTIQISMLY